MGITHEGFQVFGSRVVKNGQSINIREFENTIEQIFGIALGEGRYEELLDSGVAEEDINAADYAGYDGYNTFASYQGLMVIKSGNYYIGEFDIVIGFKPNFNRSSFEEIEVKKQVFLKELEDFKTKTGLMLTQPKYETLVSIL